MGIPADSRYNPGPKPDASPPTDGISLEQLIEHYASARASDIGQATLDRLEELQRLRSAPEPEARPKDGEPYVGPEPILLGIGKIRVAICSGTDDPKHVARELVIYDDGEGPKPVGTPEPEHAGKRADQVGKVLARLRVVNAKGAMIFASDLMTVIENAARADYGSSETKEGK